MYNIKLDDEFTADFSNEWRGMWSMLKEYLTTNELCRYLQVTRKDIMRWTRNKDIPYSRCGHKYRYKLQEVRKALNE